MARFVNSSDSISSSLLLWNDKPTQVAIEETYDLKIWPVTNLLNDGPINFNLPPQPKGLLTDLHVVTKFKLQKDGENFTTPQKDVSVVNNLAHSLWGEASVVLGDRIELLQSMRNAYAYQSFFNNALNSQQDREEILFSNELMLMDEGVSKKSEEELRVFWKWDNSKNSVFDSYTIGDSEKEARRTAIKEQLWQLKFVDSPSFYSSARTRLSATYTNADELTIAIEDAIAGVDGWVPTKANRAASIRSTRVNRGQSVILNSRLQCPLFNTSKCLPTNMKIRISLTKNKDEFLLLCPDDAGYSLVLEDCYLNATYYRVRDEVLSLIEERLAQDPAPYTITRPEIIVKPIYNSGRIIRVNDIFPDRLPPFAFFALQKSVDFEGKFSTNGFTFIPFQRFQLHKNGVPVFTDPLEVATISKIKSGDYAYRDFGEYTRQLYRTIGKDSRGNCLINNSNFALNFMAAVSFGSDRSNLSERHLNLQEKASTYIEIDLGIDDVPEDLILIVYALHDRQVQIDSERIVRLVD